MAREISAFDLDKTLLQGNSSVGFCCFLYKQRAIPCSVLFYSFFYSLRHKFMGMSLHDLHQSVFNKLLRGKPLEWLEKYVDVFVAEYVKKSLYLPAFARLKRAQQLGHFTMILSNAPSFIVKRFADLFGVNFFAATEYAVDEHKRFSRIKKILEGKDKAHHIKTFAKNMGIFFDKIHAYSDSILDLEFLQEAGNPIAVNPDKKLKKLSLKNRWSII